MPSHKGDLPDVHTKWHNGLGIHEIIYGGPVIMHVSLFIYQEEFNLLRCISEAYCPSAAHTMTSMF